MESNQLPEYLYALAEELANVLREKQTKLGLPQDAEAGLRASLAAAKYACSAYVAMLEGEEESPIAREFLVPARAACDRAEKQLRRRISISIAKASMLLD